jgi:hypothetical protein
LTPLKYPAASGTMRKLLILSLLLLPFALQGATPKMPPDKELKALVFDSLFAFNKAVQEKSFAKFHEERLSSQFQKQFPLEKFTGIFQTFIDKGYDISNIAQSEPIFDVPPATDSDGLLVLKGHYATKPNKVTFKLTYISEASAWKIMGINVQAAPSVENTGEVPTTKEARKLALDSLLLFNVAIQTKSFDNFHSKISTLWQKEVTPDELLRIFRSFTEQNVNIALIVKEQPDFDEAPTVNDDGILVLKGSYPTQPNKVFFELKYVFEDESWKLVGINVQVKPASDAPPKKGKEKKAKDSEEEDEEEPPADN